jgi:RNA recognition motif-containing protein
MSGGSTRVYIGDLGSGGSKHEIEQEFRKFGPLKSVWVARNPPGFAFVEFEDPRDAEDSVYEMDGRYVCGVRIRVELAKPSSIPGFKNRKGPRPNVVSSRFRNRSRYVNSSPNCHITASVPFQWCM